MATGKIRGKAAGNVGRSRKEVARREAKGDAGSLPDTSVWDKREHYLAAVRDIYYNGARIGKIARYVESGNIAAKGYPFDFGDYYSGNCEKIITVWKDPLADRRGMGKAKKGAGKGKPATGSVRRVRNQHRPAGK